MPTKGQINYLVVGISFLLYWYLFYFTVRADSWSLISIYTILFLGYLILLKYGQTFKIEWLFAISLLFRLIPFFALPNLSDDFYRFVWDGRLWAAGINPFAGLPSDFFNDPLLAGKGLTNELYGLLNSKGHFTVYPPVPQYINWLAAKLFPNNINYSVYFMRSIIIAAEMGSIYFIYALLKKYKIKAHLLTIYALNPLVIIELTGNLHHEALMITFLLGFLYFNTQNNTSKAAIMLALSIASKLLPLMFLPFIILSQKRWLFFLAILCVTTIFLFLPLLDTSFIKGMQDSLTLYYQNFEFNAGLYYILRQIGYWIYGYNAIALIGKILFVLSVLLIIIFSIKYSKTRYNHSYSFSMLYLIFAVLSLILHPWYIIILIALTPFTKFRFSVVWSYFIFLTYIGYSISGFSENYYVVGIEFAALLLALIMDAINYDRSSLNLNAAP